MAEEEESLCNEHMLELCSICACFSHSAVVDEIAEPWTFCLLVGLASRTDSCVCVRRCCSYFPCYKDILLSVVLLVYLHIIVHFILLCVVILF